MHNEEPRIEPSAPDTPLSDAGSRPPTKKRRRLALLILIWTFGSILFLGLAALLLVQLPFIQRLVVNEVVSAVESSTNGTLVVKSIEGNLFQGFVMRDVSLRLKTGTAYDSIPILHADEILARYSLLRWLRNDEIGITSLVLQRPTVRLVKFAGDTTWNLDLLTKHIPNAPSKPFTQIIDLASLRILNGSVLVRDYNHPARPTKLTGAATLKEKEIDWSNLDVEGLDLDSRINIHGSASQLVRVRHMRFTESNSGFFMQHLAFTASLDSLRTRLDHARITTGHSDIWLTLDVDSTKIGQTDLLASLEHSQVKLDLRAPIVNTDELKQWLPEALGFLGGSPGIDLDCSGEFGRLKIKRLGLDFKGRGAITIVGDLNNLHQPDSLWMNLALEARNLSNTTLDTYVPGLHLPDLRRFGTMNIPRLTYTGEPLNFHTVFDARSSGAGNIAADAFMDFRGKDMIYRAGVKTHAFNLAALIQKPQFESSLSAQGKVAGTGTNWKTLTATVEMKATELSTFGKRQIQTFDFAGNMKHGQAKIDRLVATVVGGPEVNVRSANIDLVSPSMPFAFDGSVDDLRLAEVLNNAAGNPARVSLDATINGAAKDFVDASGTIHAKLFDLAYGGRPLNDVTLDATLAPTRAAENNLTITSEMADVTVQNRFRLADLIHAIPAHVSAFLTAIGPRDSIMTVLRDSAWDVCADSIDFRYDVHIKDLRPLADFLPQTFVLGEGVISGTVSGCPRGDLNLTMKGDSLSFIMRNRPGTVDASPQSVGASLGSSTADSTIALIPDTLSRAAIDSTLHGRSRRPKSDTTKHAPLSLPQFTSGAPRIHLTPTSFRLEAHHLSADPKTLLDRLDATLDFASDSVLRLGSALLYKPAAQLIYKDKVLEFNLASVYNDVLGFHIAGDARFPTGAVDFALDTITAVYLNPNPQDDVHEYRWMNEGVSHIIVDNAGRVAIDTLRLVHPLRHFDDARHSFALRMNVGGSLQHDSVNAWARIDSLNLEEIGKTIPGARAAEFANYRGQVRDLAAGLHGTLARPEIGLRLRVDSMTYGVEGNQITFDSNALDLVYRDQALRGTLAMHVARIQAPDGSSSHAPDSASDLMATIDSIPMIVTLKRGPEYSADSAAIMTRPLSATVRASHFPLDVATPFLSVFSAMSGTADLRFSAAGTREHIIYDGSAKITGGQFLLAVNNMWYRCEGPVSFTDNSLKLNNLTVRNIESDDPKGNATVNGFFNFSGFNITKFDVGLHSDRLMVLSEESRKSLQAIYGPVTIATGGQDLHFLGTFKAPWLKGTVNILSAHLTLPEEAGPAQTVSSEGIVYRMLPNDSTAKGDTLHFQSAREALRWAANSGSVRMTHGDDSLFSNQMKNIYLNDDGSSALRDTTNAEAVTGTTLGPSFADILRMDLRISLQGDATVLMPFNNMFGVLGAQLDAGLKSDGAITVERGDELGLVDVNGTIDLTPNSIFRFYQTFNITSGSLQFTRDFTNPAINIVADYFGIHHDPKSGGDNQAKIELTVTGTKARPNLDAAIYTDATGSFEPRPEATRQTAIEDAIYFLASGGSFKNDQDVQVEQQTLAKISTNVGTQLFSSILQNALSSTGSQFAIRSASLQNGQAGQIFGITAAYRNIIFRANVNVSSGGQADYITDIPLNSVPNFSNPLWRTMLVEVQYHQNSTGSTAGSLIQQPLFLAKLIWIPFRW